MEIYLLRHGAAEEPLLGMRDADRLLTADGKRDLRAVLERARASGMEPGLVLSSPLLQAKQSAEVAAEILGCRDPIVETPALMPNSSPQRVWEEIRMRRETSRMLLVGHQPLLGATYAFLLQAPS